MAQKGRLKIKPVLIAINIFVLLIIISFYGIRMYKYYKSENEVINNVGETTFLSILKNKESLVDLSTGLVYDEKTNTYSYKGKTKDNYVYYSGVLFRIVGIDTAKNIKLVSDKSMTLMYSGLNKGYKESYIYKWLNKSNDIEHSGVFDNILYNKENLLTNTISCEDIVDDLTSIKCGSKNSDETYSLLTLYDYATAGLNESYLNNGESFYLMTYGENNNNYYVTSTGEIGTDTVSTKIHGVRVVISIKSDIKLVAGTGLESDPYIIEKHDIKTLDDAYIGSNVMFSNLSWKIVEKSTDGIKVVLNDALRDESGYITKSFGGSSNKYSTSKNTVGNYLNNTFYNSLENKEYIVKSNWYNGTNTIADLDYMSKYSSNINTNVGMLALSELFVSEIPNTLTMTPGIGLNNIITVINDSNNAFGDSISKEYNVRPSIYLKSGLTIYEGNGSTKEPYSINSNTEISGEE